jgi:hypothetical protein
MRMVRLPNGDAFDPQYLMAIAVCDSSLTIAFEFGSQIKYRTDEPIQVRNKILEQIREDGGYFVVLPNGHVVHPYSVISVTVADDAVEVLLHFSKGISIATKEAAKMRDEIVQLLESYTG